MANKKTSFIETETNDTKEKRKVLRQTELPLCIFEEALRIPKTIWDQFAGKEAPSIQIAKAIDVSPSSSKWLDIAGSAVAYGLTTDGYNVQKIGLTKLGKRIVSPTIDGDDKIAISESVQIPTYLNRFYSHYGNGNKLPNDNIAENMLISWGVPKDKAKSAFEIIKKNGLFAGIITEDKGNYYVQTNLSDTSVNITDISDVICKENNEYSQIPNELLGKMNITKETTQCEKENVKINNNVFVSHGKNKQMVDQLKQLLEFGNFSPVISVERETTAIPVPDKVFNDMRACSAGIIHIEGERHFLDDKGDEHYLINENVLIEIGAAIALYSSKVILLCKEGTKLPSNLQGLYRCEYTGGQLDYQSTIKLLKTINEFRGE
ncbi:MAG: nucleotide-binding protein [Bacillota bacterium]|nr:nucleotide-binding protein [Bacillota bacterium]